MIYFIQTSARRIAEKLKRYGALIFMITVSRKIGIIPKDTTITSGNPVFLDVTKPPFEIYGLCEPFRRLPSDVASAASESVAELSKMPAGGRIRFKTDSDYIVVHAGVEGVLEDDTNDTLTSRLGFDMFEVKDGKPYFSAIFVPSQGYGKNYSESRVRFPSAVMRELIIDLPLFAKVKDVYIALREGSHIDCGTGYLHKKPIVFYGSSIVHGVGAGKPASNYPAIIGRRLDSDFINLGFAGAAKAEKAVMNYISNLDMSVFVYDYDHNAPDAEYLAKTHYEGYMTVRKKQPELPIIMASKVDYYRDEVENEKRRLIIEESYERGIEAGDKNLYFVDGRRIFDDSIRNESTQDGCHPNDVGYLAMAKAFGDIIEKVI